MTTENFNITKLNYIHIVTCLYLGYGTNWGTNFNGGVGKYIEDFRPKPFGLGVGPGFVGGLALRVLSLGQEERVLMYSIFHRYTNFMMMMNTKNPGTYPGYTKKYHDEFTSK